MTRRIHIPAVIKACKNDGNPRKKLMKLKKKELKVIDNELS
jgi:hypothetical protein